MLTSTFGLAARLLVSSLKYYGPVGHLVEYFLPQYRNMANRAVKAINFNTKHLRKGDPLPPYNGTLRLYNMRYCPYAQRTVLALNAKQINYEVINVNLVEKPEWLTSKSAFGKVPALEVKEGVSIYESLVTVEYLDDVYPQRPLLSKDPVQRAFDKIIVEAIGPIHALYFKLARMPETVNEESVAAYNKALEFIQEHLQTRGTKFFGGSQPGYTDYMIWPWFERVIVVEKYEERIKIDRQKFKLLVEYIENMKQDPAVSQYLIPDDIWIKFFDSYKSGSPRYDFLD